MRVIIRLLGMLLLGARAPRLGGIEMAKARRWARQAFEKRSF